MFRLCGRVFAYNWRYYALGLFVFITFWQVFSVYSAGVVADDKLRTSMRQNAAYFEKAFLDGDVFETQRILWRIKNDNIKRITFHPVSFEGSKWIFKEAVIGNIYQRPWAQRTYSVSFISNGAELGTLEYVIDWADVNAFVFEANYVLFIAVVVLFLVLMVVSNLGSIRTILAIERSVNDINRLSDNSNTAGMSAAVKKNLEALPPDLLGVPFSQMTGKMVDSLQRTARLENELAVSKAMSDLSAQVAHDIRSPLAALDMAVKNTADMPEEQRLVIRNASNRIRDIANNLIEKYRRPDAGQVSQSVPSSTYVCLLSGLLDPLLTEKRLQFQSRPGVQLDMPLSPESYGLFASVQPVEFRRVISNLVNNAVESLGDKGMVSLRLSQAGGSVAISISDDGKGIAPEIVAKLGQKGETHGKAGGSGLGLYHARTTVEGWGGMLAIASEPGKGTAITLTLPAAEPPQWFVPELVFSPGQYVVLLDDDGTIHQVWKGRFASSRVGEQGVESLNLSEPSGLRQWVASNPDKVKEAVYLLDYELLGHRETGLALAQELGITAQSILVSSRWEEPQILAECQRLGMRLLPKNLSGLVPIRVNVAKVHCAPIVLLDDDPLVHLTWKMAAKGKGVELKPFRTAADLLSQIASLDKQAPIYIDSELGCGVKGEDIARQLHEAGFTSLYMETGHPPEEFARLKFLKGVISKDPPWQS